MGLIALLHSLHVPPLQCIAPQFDAIYCIAFHCTAPCNALHPNSMQCNALHFIAPPLAMHCIALHATSATMQMNIRTYFLKIFLIRYKLWHHELLVNGSFFRIESRLSDEA